MSGTQRSGANLLQYIRLQVQQPQGIGHRRARLSHPPGGLLLGQAVVLQQAVIALRLLHRVEILALEIFNERQLHGLPVIGLYYQSRNLRQSCHSGRPPAPLSGDDLVIAGMGHLPHRQGLQNAMFPNGVRQSLKLFFIEIPTGLVRIGLYLL